MSEVRTVSQSLPKTSTAVSYTHLEGPDGSRVRAFRIPQAYCTPGGDREAHIRAVAEAEQEGVESLMCFYGVGNHGGGPTRANLDSILRMREDLDLPAMAFSSPNNYFVSVSKKDLPTWKGELQHHASGCYAAHSGIKRWNRQAENALLSAEAFSAAAERVTGQPWPEGLDRAWKNVLFNQFHDVLAGTSLRSAYADARDMHGEAMSIAARAQNAALQSLAWNIRAPEAEGDARYLVVFNPHAWPARECIQFERDVWRDDARVSHTAFGVTDDAGNATPCQALPAEGVTLFRTRQAFMADLPPLGYRVYTVRPRTGEEPWPDLPAGDSFLENEHLRLELDPATGEPARLVHKASGRSVLAGGGAVVIEDPSDTWSHGVRRFEDEAGAFALQEMRLVERGPVLARIRVRSVFGDSTIIRDYTVFAGVPYVRVDATVDWRERLRMLKLRFATPLEEPTATYEIPYGALERPADGEEEPVQAWMDLSGRHPDGGRAGLSVLNDGKYSASMLGSTMCLTVLRSPIYAHHEPLAPAPGGEYAFIDQGEQRFAYALLPHAGDWRAAETVRRAAELNRAAVTVPGRSSGGTLPPSGSFASCDAMNVAVSALKRAEDGDGLIVRAYEAAGQAAKATIRLTAWETEIAAEFGPFEIRTFRVRTGEQPFEVNLLEELTIEN